VLKSEGSSLGAAIQAVFEGQAPAAAPVEPQEVRPRRRRGERPKKAKEGAQAPQAPAKVEKSPEQTLTIRPKKPQVKKEQPKAKPQAPAEAAPKAEGSVKKPFHRRRRPGGGNKPQGGEK
jgi:hypothetical protein